MRPYRQKTGWATSKNAIVCKQSHTTDSHGFFRPHRLSCDAHPSDGRRQRETLACGPHLWTNQCTEPLYDSYSHAHAHTHLVEEWYHTRLKTWGAPVCAPRGLWVVVIPVVVGVVVILVVFGEWRDVYSQFDGRNIDLLPFTCLIRTVSQ